MSLFEFYRRKVYDNPLYLKFVPEFFINEKMCRTAICRNGLALEYVPKKLKDWNTQFGRKICIVAMQKDPYAIIYIDPKHQKMIKNIERNPWFKPVEEFLHYDYDEYFIRNE
jgi:hypothetical protein